MRPLKGAVAAGECEALLRPQSARRRQGAGAGGRGVPGRGGEVPAAGGGGRGRGGGADGSGCCEGQGHGGSRQADGVLHIVIDGRSFDWAAHRALPSRRSFLPGRTNAHACRSARDLGPGGSAAARSAVLRMLLLGGVDGRPSFVGYGPSRGLSLNRKSALKSVGQSHRLTKFAFPNGQHTPPMLAQQSRVGMISLSGALQFWHPELQPHCWHFASRAIVSVPEAAVYEHDGAVTLQHDVGGSRKRALVKPKPQPQSMQDGTHRHFGRCV